jgi:hypothetical protein
VGPRLSELSVCSLRRGSTRLKLYAFEAQMF